METGQSADGVAHQATGVAALTILNGYTRNEGENEEPSRSEALFLITERSTKASQSKSGPEPHVGIFWLLDGTLLTDSTPLSQAEPYGDHLTHPRSHIDVWDGWQKLGKVPADVPYEESPRGRVVFNPKTSQSVLLADKCILERKSVVAEITKALGLTKNVTLGSDSHYRCSKCLYGSDTEEDWD